MSSSMKIACIGECMIEVANLPDDIHAARLGYGGDTLNTAIYLSRLLQGTEHQTHYATLLGDDPSSLGMSKAWALEGIRCDLVEHLTGREAGLYMIHLDSHGERHFNYWREHAPVRAMFDGSSGQKRIDALADFDAIFFSGITLAILNEEGRHRLIELAQTLKVKGHIVIYDTNHRPRLWAGHNARAINQQALFASTLALPSSEDLEGIFGQPDQGWKSLLDGFNIAEIVLKHGGKPLDLFADGQWSRVLLEPVSSVVDTTAAGDSFNGGYIAGRLLSQSPTEATHMAHQLASRVIAHNGAVIPQDAMPEFRSNGSDK